MRGRDVPEGNHLPVCQQKQKQKDRRADKAGVLACVRSCVRVSVGVYTHGARRAETTGKEESRQSKYTIIVVCKINN